MMPRERKRPQARTQPQKNAPIRAAAPSIWPLGQSELVFLALLLPLLIGGIVVFILRHQTPSWTSSFIPFLGIMILGGAGFLYNLDRRVRERPHQGAIRITSTILPGIATGVAFVCALLAALLTANALFPALAIILWMSGLFIFIGHALQLERPKLHPPTPIDALALIGLLLLTVLLRLPYLTDFPSFIHSDEAQMGLHTRFVLDGSMPSLFATTDWWSVPWLGPAMQAPLLLLFGDDLFAVRIASVIASLFATAGLWFLGSELWSRRAGFVTALLFTVLAPNIHFGRDGVHYMQSIAALIWTVLCYIRATKRYSGTYAAVTGILIGIDAQLYYAARLAIPLIFAHAIICTLLERGLFRNWLRLILWTALGLIITLLPMGVYYLLHPTTFAQRSDAVMIFSQTPLVKAAIAHDYQTAGWFDILGRQVQRVVLGFLAFGDRSEQYNSSSPLLDAITATLLPAACVVALARVRKSAWLLCALWLGITVILGGVLTTYQPDAPRLLPALPVVCLLIGGFVHTLLIAAGEIKQRDAKPILAIVLAGSLVATSLLNVNDYFDSYPVHAATQPITLVTDVARFLSTASSQEEVVLFDQREFYIGHWSIQLLAPQVHGTTVWNTRDLMRALERIHGPFLLVSVDRTHSELTPVYTAFPGGVTQRVPVHDVHHIVVSYRYPGSIQGR